MFFGPKRFKNILNCLYDNGRLVQLNLVSGSDYHAMPTIARGLRQRLVQLPEPLERTGTPREDNQRPRAESLRLRARRLLEFIQCRTLALDGFDDRRVGNRLGCVRCQQACFSRATRNLYNRSGSRSNGAPFCGARGGSVTSPLGIVCSSCGAVSDPIVTGFPSNIVNRSSS
jgi:hypothetical protein